MTASVLLLIYNRPEMTADVFATVRAARPPRLYVAADGPRAGDPNDECLCERARSIISEVNWPCQVRTLFRKHNIGCRPAVVEAVSWFFDCETEGIILEDDCVPNSDFYCYVEELLRRYRHEDRIMSITGTNVFGTSHNTDSSYFFSIYPQSWGWATWRRAWNLYDDRLNDLTQFLSCGAFQGNAATPSVARRWEERFLQARDYGLDSWFTVWTFACWVHKGLTCAPRINLVSNVGHGPQGTHTWDCGSKFSNVPSQKLVSPLEHPSLFVANDVYDSLMSTDFYEIDPFDQTTVAESLERNILSMKAALSRSDDSNVHINVSRRRA